MWKCWNSPKKQQTPNTVNIQQLAFQSQNVSRLIKARNNKGASTRLHKDLLDIKINFRWRTLPGWFFGSVFSGTGVMRCYDWLFFNSFFLLPQRYNSYCTSCFISSFAVAHPQTVQTTWRHQTHPHRPGRLVMVGIKVFIIITSVVSLLFPDVTLVLASGG